jgi:high-affinity iron transporter
MLSLGVVVSSRAQGGADLKNPVAADAKSLAEGKQLFSKQCASCHGAAGKGDGKAGETLKPKPADLTDAMWAHGSSDGEIFTVIRDGVKETSMRGFAGRMTSRELWTLVNYVRSLAPKG